MRKHLWSLMIAVVALMAMALFPKAAMAELPKHSFTARFTSEGPMITVGENTEIEDILPSFREKFRIATKDAEHPNGLDLTWRDVYAAAKKRHEGKDPATFPFFTTCRTDKDGRQMSRRGSEAVWKNCEEDHKGIILTYGHSGEFLIPMKSQVFVEDKVKIACWDDESCLAKRYAEKTGKQVPSTASANTAASSTPAATSAANAPTTSASGTESQTAAIQKQLADSETAVLALRNANANLQSENARKPGGWTIGLLGIGMLCVGLLFGVGVDRRHVKKVGIDIHDNERYLAKLKNEIKQLQPIRASRTSMTEIAPPQTQGPKTLKGGTQAPLLEAHAEPPNSLTRKLERTVGELKRTIQDISQEKGRLEQMNGDLKKINDRLERDNRQLTASNESMQKLQNQNAEAFTARENAQRVVKDDLEKAKTAMTVLETAKANLQADKETLLKRVDELLKQNAGSNPLTKVGERLGELEQRIDVLKAEKLGGEFRCRELDAEILALKGTITKLEAAHSILETASAEVRAANETLQRENAEQKQRFEKVDTYVDDRVTSKLASSKKVIEELRNSVTSLERENKVLKTTNVDLDAVITTIKDAFAQLLFARYTLREGEHRLRQLQRDFGSDDTQTRDQSSAVMKLSNEVRNGTEELVAILVGLGIGSAENVSMLFTSLSGVAISSLPPPAALPADIVITEGDNGAMTTEMSAAVEAAPRSPTLPYRSPTDDEASHIRPTAEALLKEDGIDSALEYITSHDSIRITPKRWACFSRLREMTAVVVPELLASSSLLIQEKFETPRTVLATLIALAEHGVPPNPGETPAAAAM